jgi:hypothetical protein
VDLHRRVHQPTDLKILADKADGERMGFDKRNVGCSSAERLNSQSPAAGIEVQDPRSFNLGSED